MKNSTYLLSLIIVLLLSTTTGYSQNMKYKNGLSFKALLLDYQTFNGGSFSDFKSYHRGMEFGYHRNVLKNLNVNIPLRIGVVQNHNGIESVHKNIYGGDIKAQYWFNNDDWMITPFATLGVGGVLESDQEFDFQVPAGVGLNFKVSKYAFINVQSEYRKSFSDDRDNLQHSLGFIYLLSPKRLSTTQPNKPDNSTTPGSGNDSDGDGITDDLDLCPQAKGPKALSGCPDSDGDGVADYEDVCPQVAGLTTLQGCPDSDGDGVSDQDDECPNLAGNIANNGCPSNDADGDGVPNAQDKCPDIAGPASNGGCPGLDADGDGVTDDIDRCPQARGTLATKGCPDSDGDGVADFEDKCPTAFGEKVYSGCPDSDGDGIDDSRDKCPHQAGSVATSGCPGISAEDQRILDIAVRSVAFDTGRSTLKSESHGILNQIADIMAKYPNYTLAIHGHTDNTGSARANLALSERRAKACYTYLITRGVPASSLSYKGYGETKPINNNNTLRGRALNRRVEFNLNLK